MDSTAIIHFVPHTYKKRGNPLPTENNYNYVVKIRHVCFLLDGEFTAN